MLNQYIVDKNPTRPNMKNKFLYLLYLLGYIPNVCYNTEMPQSLAIRILRASQYDPVGYESN